MISTCWDDEHVINLLGANVHLALEHLICLFPNFLLGVLGDQLDVDASSFELRKDGRSHSTLSTPWPTEKVYCDCFHVKFSLAYYTELCPKFNKAQAFAWASINLHVWAKLLVGLDLEQYLRHFFFEPHQTFP